MWTTEYIFSQICVLIAVVFFSASYLTKKRSFILLYLSIAALFYGLEYLLLGSVTGFIVNLVAIFRGIIYYVELKYCKKNSLCSLLLIESLVITVGLETWSSVALSLLPILANLIFGYSVWQKNNLVFRVLSIFASIIWITFNILVFSVLGIIQEIAVLIIEIIGFIKCYKKKSEVKV